MALSDVDARFCDEELGDAGFGWVAEEAATRTSHALVCDGRVWLVDPLDWPQAIDRARQLGDPAAVLQLLDRHDRDCAAIASGLGIPHLVVPDSIPTSPFDCIRIRQGRFWKERALWWPERRTLVVADALGTNRFYTGGRAPVGVHVLMRLAPPKRLGDFEPEHVLTGHGAGLHGPGTAETVSRALVESRRRLPGVLLRLPLAARG